MVDVETSRVSCLRTIVETLREMTPDANIRFGSTSMCVESYDRARVSIIAIEIGADLVRSDPRGGRFDVQLGANRTHIDVGVTLSVLFKVLKSFGDGARVRLEINSDTMPDILSIKGLRADGQVSREYCLNTLNLDPLEISLNNTEIEWDFDMVVNSHDFQQACRDLNVVECQRVTLTTSVEGVVLTSRGMSGNVRIVVESDYTVESDDDMSVTVPLGYLHCFMKCAKISDTVRLLMKRDGPILVWYDVEHLGSVKFLLAPCVMDTPVPPPQRTPVVHASLAKRQRQHPEIFSDDEELLESAVKAPKYNSDEEEDATHEDECDEDVEHDGDD